MAEKKTSVKKTTAKKELKVNSFIQFYGKETDEKTIVAEVKKAWRKTGKKVGDMKTLQLYMKPEENLVYYVINGDVSGTVTLFTEE